MDKIVVGTRGSQLALRQTRTLVEDLQHQFPKLKFEIQTIQTVGDRTQDRSFSSMGVKGIFVKELDDALKNGSIDCAVHSLKDLPAVDPNGIVIGFYSPREDPRDAFLSNGIKLKDLPSGARVGTASVRRQAMIRRYRPDLQIDLLRGNLDTRIRKLEAQEFDGVLLAAAGLRRMGWEHKITEYLDSEEFVPAPGQGIVVATYREEDFRMKEILQRNSSFESELFAKTQRRVMSSLQGGCQIPLGCFATLNREMLCLHVKLVHPFEDRQISSKMAMAKKDWITLVDQVVHNLQDQGVEELLRQIREQESGA